MQCNFQPRATDSCSQPGESDYVAWLCIKPTQKYNHALQSPSESNS